MVDEFDKVVGCDRLGALHVNDSMTELGSNRDRHANLGDGEIGVEGMAAFLSEPRFEGLPVIFEGPAAARPRRGDRARVDMRVRAASLRAPRAAERRCSGRTRRSAAAACALRLSRRRSARAAPSQRGPLSSAAAPASALDL